MLKRNYFIFFLFGSVTYADGLVLTNKALIRDATLFSTPIIQEHFSFGNLTIGESTWDETKKKFGAAKLIKTKTTFENKRNTYEACFRSYPPENVYLNLIFLQQGSELLLRQLTATSSLSEFSERHCLRIKELTLTLVTGSGIGFGNTWNEVIKKIPQWSFSEKPNLGLAYIHKKTHTFPTGNRARREVELNTRSQLELFFEQERLVRIAMFRWESF